jgi:Predicted transcriptional regulators
MNHETLGQMVREARLARNMTQRQLAELAGLHQNQVNGIENAHLPKYYPKLLNAIVDALDLDRDEVFALPGGSPRTSRPRSPATCTPSSACGRSFPY